MTVGHQHGIELAGIHALEEACGNRIAGVDEQAEGIALEEIAAAGLPRSREGAAATEDGQPHAPILPPSAEAVGIRVRPDS
jgi:hypothetical protein